ncbi:unnamed protein product, partial [marine sediment metagenome]
IEMKMIIAKHLGVADEDVEMESVGLNHLGWVRKVTVKGEDVLPGLLEFLASEEGPKNIPDAPFDPETITALGAVPLWYCRYFYNTDSVLDGLKKKKQSRAEEVMAIEQALLAKYRDPAQVTKPPELDERGGAYYSKIAIEVIDAFVNDTGVVHAVNTNNRGAMPDLADESV